MTLLNKDPIDEALARIARKHIAELKGRKTLKPFYSDEHDFFKTSVWSLDAALREAYELGQREHN